VYPENGKRSERQMTTRPTPIRLHKIGLIAHLRAEAARDPDRLRLAAAAAIFDAEPVGEPGQEPGARTWPREHGKDRT